MDKEKPKLYYAAWWRRFAAFWIDYFLLSPLMYILIRIASTSPRLYAVILIPFCAIFIGYFIFCHGRWGRTLGKLVTGTRVTALDGSHISWKQAFLRNTVDIVLNIFTWFALIPIYLNIPIEGYADLTTQMRFNLIESMWPTWYSFVDVTGQVWVWSEFVVILLNKRRRALHDFIAGTIVIQKTPTRRQAIDEDT